MLCVPYSLGALFPMCPMSYMPYVIPSSLCLSAAVKEAAVQRRHNLYRDSMVLNSSDPNLHLLEENPAVDWAGQYGAGEESSRAEALKRRKQVVSMIQLDGAHPLLYESCLDVPGVEDIPEEREREAEAEEEEEEEEGQGQNSPKSPDSVSKIRDLINPKVAVEVPITLPALQEGSTPLTNGTLPEAEPAHCHDDSGFQSPTNEGVGEEEEEVVDPPITEAVADPERVVVTLEPEDSKPREEHSGKVALSEPDIVINI
ncbi:hypothetical protein JZ751_025946 [Albula glossodonta]|uniref:Uncharacterized protein n=1 Tax=Albula glossodonta TaxID=121402 RepID=A0A8T2MXS9_9TELE|nr:hypothetical protein JZ751_025946 [Albula glossodonta]